MPRRDRTIDDDDILPVIVPRNDKALAPISAERIQKLSEHLLRVSAGEKAQSAPSQSEPVRPEPNGLAAKVARTACTLCRGFCCKNGADDGFLDEATLARALQDGIVSDLAALVRLYLGRVPDVGYHGSCIFHGKAGCTLDRSLRSDVCNSYFCGGLHAYMTSGDATTPAIVIAGEDGGKRRSPVLWP